MTPLVRVRLGISNLKVHKDRYVRSDIAQENDCPICPGFREHELHSFFVCKAYGSLRPGMLKNIEPHIERAQFIRLMSCQVECVIRKNRMVHFQMFRDP